MQLRELAERALFGDTLADKLVAVEILEDDRPGAAVAPPPLPGRPEALRLDLGQPRARFPRVGSLVEPEQRGRMLHFFANHELMALELMALVLLRFPEAPPKWRRGLANTLVEEQTHLRLYLERMQALGVGFGEIPVNRFFWDHLAGVSDPRAFAAQMGLVFEQANLDHCLYYAEICRDVGDEETAALLDRVYRDELGHVRHSLSWFRRWSPQARSLWEAWVSELAQPVSPERAKGVVFSAEARRAVGFPEDYIRRLALSRTSKGRPPVVRWFTAACEHEVGGGGESELERRARQDLELLPVVFSGRDDLVLVSQEPSLDALEGLRDAGFELPEFHVAPFPTTPDLGERKLGRLEPWGWTPAVRRWLAPLEGQLGEAPPASVQAFTPLWDKRSAGRLLAALLRGGGPELIGEEALPIEITEIQSAEMRLADGGTWVVKQPFSTAGRGARRLTEALSPKDLAWLEAGLARFGGLRMEPWLPRVVDLSVHLSVTEEGARVDGVTRFFTTAGGRYTGSVVGPWRTGLEPALHRFLSGSGQDRRWFPREVSRLAEQVGAFAGGLGYLGPISVDAMICARGGGFALHPLLELNPRITMGRVALRLREHLAPRRIGLFVVASPAERRAAGARDFCELASRWAAPEVAEGRFAGGVLPLGDPARAEALLPAFVVAPELSACQEALWGRIEAAEATQAAQG
ncbi:MAG: DUF455 family protein [Alphaproteobacteria bacterium]|nr:DUF455 family protein [Alphaproteobacteria bacterium]